VSDVTENSKCFYKVCFYAFLLTFVNMP